MDGAPRQRQAVRDLGEAEVALVGVEDLQHPQDPVGGL
jgi:hypothetical protein